MIRASLSFSRRMFASQKAATGLVGLPVADDGIAELKEVSTNILQQIQVCPSNLSNCAISSFYFRLFIFLKTFTLQGSVATRMSLRALSLMAACLCVMSCCLLSWPTATLYSPRILFFFRFFIIYLIISPFSGSWKLTLLVYCFCSLFFGTTPIFLSPQSQALPEDAKYRKNVESLYQHRLKLCETNTDVFKVESELGLGNIEEVIAMGYDELNLIPVYVEGKMHEN